MKSVITIGLFIGVLLITVGYVNQLQKCPPPTIEYRYIPRTFKEDQDNLPQVSEIFTKMFQEPTPWISGFKMGSDNSKHSLANRYFITQGEIL